MKSLLLFFFILFSLKEYCKELTVTKQFATKLSWVLTYDCLCECSVHPVLKDFENLHLSIWNTYDIYVKIGEFASLHFYLPLVPFPYYTCIQVLWENDRWVYPKGLTRLPTKLYHGIHFSLTTPKLGYCGWLPRYTTW